MIRTAVANEFAKMRHLRIGLLVALLLIGVVGMVVFYSLGSGIGGMLADPDDTAWKTLLAALGTAASLISPVLLAVVASRQVEIEHVGNGWLSSSTSGLSPGQMCRAKLFALGIPVAVTTIAWGVLLVGFGRVLGITASVPTDRWAGYILSLLVINLAVLAFHVLLSAKVENQIVCIGIGVVGIFIAYFGSVLPPWLSHFIPWGYYSLTTPADYVGTDAMAYLNLPYVSIGGLFVVGTTLFVLFTHRFDRQEA
ncbi:ABC transporter permease [Corynebacterium glyciniphilum]|uniref:ABC transporter permease n=1 Tax=Corynebacterium glyciniphilum TaxID=1404244 RepID=UPI003DA17877